MSKNKQVQGLSVVFTKENFPQIHEGFVAQFVKVITDFKLAEDQNGHPNPKMVTQLLSRVVAEVNEHYEDATRAYVSRRFEEQVGRYIALGMHEHAGYSEEQFRVSLTPLLKKVQDFFAPPAEHSITKGEFTLLLVLPPKMLPLRRQLVTLNGPSLDDEDTLLCCSRLELTTHGKAAPDEPYVLVGINAGRGLKEVSIAQADEFVRTSGKKYFSAHELIQLLLIRPKFLSRMMGLTTQSEVFALGEKHSTRGLIKFVAYPVGYAGVTFVREHSVYGGAGVGKPYYAHMITM